MPHVVKALPFHRKPSRAARHIAYIARGEKDGPAAEKRELYGVGERYTEVSRSIADPDERRQALERLLIEDAGRTSRPVFHSHIFTLDNDAATKLAAMDRPVAEQRLRHLLRETFNASATGRRLQGMYAIHWDGGYRRPAHPHIHAVYSPMQSNGRPIYIGPKQLAQIKGGWNRAVDNMLGRVPKRAPLKTTDLPLRAGKSAVRAAFRAQAFARNPARAAVQMAGRSLLRGVLQPRGRAVIPKAPVDRMAQFAVSLAAKGAWMSLRLALGKLAIPVTVARAMMSVSLDRGRER